MKHPLVRRPNNVVICILLFALVNAFSCIPAFSQTNKKRHKMPAKKTQVHKSVKKNVTTKITHEPVYKGLYNFMTDQHCGIKLP